MSIQLNEELRDLLLSLLKDRVTNVFASLVYGAYAGGYANENSALDALVIVESNKITLRSWSERIMNKKVRFLIIDKKSFEKDVKYEYFGGIFSENLVTPYKPIISASYLWSQEIEVKKSIINSILKNLVLGFPEMSRDLLIEPEYFMYEYLMRRSALFPLISYRFLNVLKGENGEKNVRIMMEGFRAAIRDLINDGILSDVDGRFLKISEEYIAEAKKISHYLAGLFGTVRTNIIRYIFGLFPEIRESLIEERKIYKARYSKETLRNSLRILEDSRKHLFIPTALGLMPFTEKLSVKDFVNKYLLRGSPSKYSIKRLGSVLNSVLMLKFFDNNVERKLIVKIFKDWYGWKWFPLTLWTLGTRSFTVMGKARLEKEYVMNRFLSSHGINVPAIIYANPEEKVIIQEYIEGVAASKVIKQLCKAKEEERETLLEIIRRVGCEIARVHGLGVSIGDCKPENILITHDGRIFFVDLEQGEREGDQAWDIAEFLYYLGHYILLPKNIIEDIVMEFINGYITSGGRLENIKRALSLKYVRVFSFFTPPHTILTIVGSCKKALKTFES